ncbi:MAG: hypothetical protein GVY29_04955 [Spirochaetes bacterium]|jgi:hypothetical protein|nr:hypothetical protein [Spirochaetota bacterium]
MGRFDIASLRNLFEDQGVMICFNGPFSHSVIEQLGDAVRNYLQSANAPQDSVADVFSVFIEQAQNLKNYAASTSLGADEYSPERNGTLAIAREEGRYIVSSGNIIRNEEVTPLRQRLAEIASADAEELKKMYKKRLREPVAEGEGPGLGLIFMARKSPEPLRFSIREHGKGTAFFTIGVVI